MSTYKKISMFLLFIISYVLIGCNIYAGNLERPYTASSILDTPPISEEIYDVKFNRPQGNSGEIVKYANDYPGLAYVLANRHLDGHWNHEVITASGSRHNDHHGGSERGSDPGYSVVSYTKTVYASSYGFNTFEGWTKVPGSNIGKKSGNGDGYFSNYGGLSGHSSSVPSYMQYVNLPINGESQYWLSRWDFWGSGGWNATGTVDVTISSDKKSATITRTAYIGSTGYANAPLFHNHPGPNGRQWHERFHLNPEDTRDDSHVYNSYVCSRLYGLGERIYFFGKTAPPPPPSPDNVTLIASLQELADHNNPGNGNWLDPNNLITEKYFKSGYGIPLIVEIQGYNYQPKSTGCAYMTSIVGNVTIESSDVKIINTDLDTNYINATNISGIFTLEKVKDSGSGSAASLKQRFVLKQQVDKSTNPNKYYYPLGKRKLYTDPTEPNKRYSIEIEAIVTLSFTERYVSGSYCCQEYCACSCCPIWSTRDITDTVRQTVTVYPSIQGSMFDDDQVIITR